MIFSVMVREMKRRQKRKIAIQNLKVKRKPPLTLKLKL